MLGGKHSVLCVRVGEDSESYICYHISSLTLEVKTGVNRSISGGVVEKTSRGYFRLKALKESYLPEKSWSLASDNDKLSNFTLKAGSVLLYDTEVTPTGNFSDLLNTYSNSSTVTGYNVYISNSPLDNLEIEVS